MSLNTLQEIGSFFHACLEAGKSFTQNILRYPKIMSFMLKIEYEGFL